MIFHEPFVSQMGILVIIWVRLSQILTIFLLLLLLLNLSKDLGKKFDLT